MEIDWPTIVREHGPLVWKTALRLLLNQADVSDCFQETFLSALEFSRTKSVDNWPALLRRIALSRALDLLRKRVRQQRWAAQEANDDLPSREIDPQQQAQANELSDRLRIALTELPPTQSQAFCLRYLNEMDYVEIAAEMGISVDAAGALLFRARAKLAELLIGTAAADVKR